MAGSTDHFMVERNELFTRLTLRCDLEFAAALYLFTKKGPYQKVLHELKYRGVFDIAYNQGRRFGIKYKQLPQLQKAEIIIPMPVHWRRKLRRGYNQAEIFAKGIAHETKVPVRTDVLKKRIGMISQTTKNRQERVNRIYESFVCKNAERVTEKRVLLVDDVLTTGATAEAAVTALNSFAIKKIQLGLIALAIN